VAESNRQGYRLRDLIKAVVVSKILLGLAGIAKITVVNRSAARGTELVDLLRKKLKLDATFVLWEGDYKVPSGTDVVINATSIGLYDPDPRLNLDASSLAPGMVVADVIGNPPRTRLIRDAQSRGCKALDGLGMLVNQGIIAVRFWTGIDLDEKVTRAALEKALGL
jgi:shikimate dehydrogenase